MEYEKRYMKPEDWIEEKVMRVPHLNSSCIPSGYNRSDGVCGNPLLPACVFEDKLGKIFKSLNAKIPNLFLKRVFVKMPYWSRGMTEFPELYSIIDKAERLVSTAITVVLVSKNKMTVKKSKLNYAFNKGELNSLRERLNIKSNEKKLIGNLGYYMTENLIEGILPWTHNKRYKPEFHLKTVKSYLGFYYYQESNRIFSTFMGAHRACVSVKSNREIEIIPELKISKYLVRINGKSFEINSANPSEINDKVVVFTPEFRTEKDIDYLYNLDKYAPLIPSGETEKRVNIFVGNEGDGSQPKEKIIKVWHGPAPLPSFGAVISMSEDYYKELFDNIDLINSDIEVIPYAENLDFADYLQVYGGFVPLVADFKHLYDVNRVDELMSAMDQYGNALSPLAQAGRETRNFDPYIREPAGLFIETDNETGWILFDGRHELSIGVSISDVVKILKLFEKDSVIPGNVKNAVFIDGGSAMKAYIAEIMNKELELSLLNRAAAGARNGPGEDTNGLNLYSTLTLEV